MILRVLELGNFIVPAYAGMLLAEQGARVEKWTNGRDPILGCRSGGELWDWVNYRKTLVDRPVASLPGDPPAVDVVLDNFRPGTPGGLGGRPGGLGRAARLGLGVFAERGRGAGLRLDRPGSQHGRVRPTHPLLARRHGRRPLARVQGPGHARGGEAGSLRSRPGVGLAEAGGGGS